MNYLQLTTSTELPDISRLRPFKAIVIAEELYAEDRQAAISTWLVESGCLYMLAWGPDCSSWKGSVDAANARAHADCEEIPDNCLVITTAHENEMRKDVFWFSKHSAMHPCHQLDNVVLVHLSATDREQELSVEYSRA